MAKKRTKNEKEQYVMICPKCKSPDVCMDKSNPLQPVIGLPTNYICNNCKFKGFNFPEIKASKVKKVQKEINGSKRDNDKKEKPLSVDTAYGDFIVRAVWKISAPIILLLGIFLLFSIPFLGIVIAVVGIIMLYFAYIKK
ncbi:hypothetical protein GF371_04555 [Candidatus Woesearchaeota archaeon]|nr:hypothetical protein [Candidatus Woesearchaeota archaeon]